MIVIHICVQALNHNKGNIQLFVSIFRNPERRKTLSPLVSSPSVVLISALHHALNQFIVLHIFIFIHIHSYVLVTLGGHHLPLRLSTAPKLKSPLILVFATPIRDLRLLLSGCKPKVTSGCAPDPRPRIFPSCLLHGSLPKRRKSIALERCIARFWCLIVTSSRSITVRDGAERAGTPW